jgi:O-methyltransferase
MYRLLDQVAGAANGDVAECGVFRGGTARLMAELLRDKASNKQLHLFDTFEGMPETDSSRDRHMAGDFGNTSLSAVRSYVEEASYGNVSYHAGLLPDTLSSVENSTFCFVHIDLDIYKPIIDTTAFFYERVPRGAFLLYDDYAWPSCPGARQAVDEFYADKPEKPLVLATGQCLVVKA